jgi:hypothetical protein
MTITEAEKVDDDGGVEVLVAKAEIENFPLFVLPDPDDIAENFPVSQDEVGAINTRVANKDPFALDSLPFSNIRLTQAQVIDGSYWIIKEQPNGFYLFGINGRALEHHVISMIKKGGYEVNNKRIANTVQIFCLLNYLQLVKLLKSPVVYRYKQTFARPERRRREKQGHPTTVIYLSDKPREQVSYLRDRNDLTQLESWYVRGFWRRMSGTGCNRQGERVVEGFTWVKPHVRGNKGATLPASKTYKIKE